jgi:hypothetical protein
MKRISGSGKFRSSPRKDFFNSIGTNRTNRDVRCTVAIDGKADMARKALFGRD